MDFPHASKYRTQNNRQIAGRPLQADLRGLGHESKLAITDAALVGAFLGFLYTWITNKDAFRF